MFFHYQTLHPSITMLKPGYRVASNPDSHPAFCRLQYEKRSESLGSRLGTGLGNARCRGAHMIFCSSLLQKMLLVAPPPPARGVSRPPTSRSLWRSQRHQSRCHTLFVYCHARTCILLHTLCILPCIYPHTLCIYPHTLCILPCTYLLLLVHVHCQGTETSSVILTHTYTHSLSHTHTHILSPSHSHSQDAKRTTHSLEDLSSAAVAEGTRLVAGSSSADNLFDVSPVLHHGERTLAGDEPESVETNKGRKQAI